MESHGSISFVGRSNRFTEQETTFVLGMGREITENGRRDEARVKDNAASWRLPLVEGNGRQDPTDLAGRPAANR
jgi:hypothetical protein